MSIVCNTKFPNTLRTSPTVYSCQLEVASTQLGLGCVCVCERVSVGGEWVDEWMSGEGGGWLVHLVWVSAWFNLVWVSALTLFVKCAV